MHKLIIIATLLTSGVNVLGFPGYVSRDCILVGTKESITVDWKNNNRLFFTETYYKMVENKKIVNKLITTEESNISREPGALGSNSDTTNEDKTITVKKNKSRNSGNGRNGANAYNGLNVIAHKHITGNLCPKCENEYNTISKLYFSRTQFIIALHGTPPLFGEKHVYDVYRCYNCNEMYDSLPEEVRNAPKYDSSCYASIIMHKYQLGVPFYRIAKAQDMTGIPLPASTQWDLVNKFAAEVEPVYKALEQVASNAEQVGFDDTDITVLYNAQGIKGDTANHTTAVRAECKDTKIILFYSGNKCAGSNISNLMKARKNDEPIISMSDASSQNFALGIPDNILTKWIICYCLGHGRRKFYDLINIFPIEVKFILEQIAIVYYNDQFCKTNKFDNNKRLKYHQKYSQPVMDALYIWFNNKLLYKQVEANSELGKSIAYMLKYWHQLTQFLRIPGAKLDNNLVEQVIKTAVLHRKNSLFYKTPRGAKVGDIFMSLIQTCAVNKVNPYTYLQALKENTAQVKLSPLLWLPWNYHLQLQQVAVAA